MAWSPPTTTGFLPIWSSPIPSERREGMAKFAEFYFHALR
jgi:hypothetical protein